MKNVNRKKASQDTDIPTRILYENSNLFAQFNLNNSSDVITTSRFPDIVKHASVRPVCEKHNRNEEENYQPVSILNNVSKVYEKWMFDETETDFHDILLKYQCLFRHRFVKCFWLSLTWTAHCYIICLWFWINFTKVNLFLPVCKEKRVNLDYEYSSYEIDAPQGSILGLFLFNIFTCDLFLFADDIDIASYADDNTSYGTWSKKIWLLKNLISVLAVSLHGLKMAEIVE